jgi:hypothetical protein
MPRSNRYYSSLIAFFLLCFCANSAKATTAVMVSDEDLAISSRLIVVGEVRSVTSAWDATHTVAWTYVEVYCERVLKGELQSNTIVLKQLGADFADSGFHVFGQPKFTVGQQTLLYLSTSADGNLRVAHNFMGKFNIETDPVSGQSLVSRSLQESEVELLTVHREAEVTERAQLKEHIRKIRKSLREQPDAVARYDAIHRATAMVEVPSEFAQVHKQQDSVSPQFEFSGGGVRWMEADSGQAVGFAINNARSPVSTGGSAEITTAMNAWAAQSGASIRLQISGQTGSCGLQNDGANVISFGDCLNQLDTPIGCSGVVAQTTVRWTSESKVVGGRTFHRIIESDLVFNDGMDCFLGNPTNLAEVACHELGHAIGLGHSLDLGAIMWPSARGNRGATLGDDDKAGVLAIYPSTTGGGGGGGGGGTTPVNDAAFISQNVPSTLTPGQSTAVSVTMRNSGTTNWNATCRLRSENPTGNATWGLGTVSLPATVTPGAQVTFTFTITAPATPGIYNFQWRMMKDGPGSFGSLTPNIPINVSTGDGGGGGQVQITSLNLSEGTVGRSYKQTLSATGGRAPYQWQIASGSLPQGLTFSSSGVIEGIPTRAGSYSFGLQVYDVTSNPANSDAERVVINIAESGGGGGGSNVPVINRIKIKGVKKLFVIGQNFTNQSFIILNDVFLTPLSLEVDGTTGTLFYKGKLTLREEGTNTVKVITGSTASTTFFF